MEKFITKHTPGPWRVLPDEESKHEPGFYNDCYNSIVAGVGYLTSEARNSGFNITGYVSIENAQLIAAAPLLLSALIDLISICEENPSVPGQWWSKGVPTNDQLNRAKAAIAAAGVVVEESKSEN